MEASSKGHLNASSRFSLAMVSHPNHSCPKNLLLTLNSQWHGSCSLHKPLRVKDIIPDLSVERRYQTATDVTYATTTTYQDIALDYDSYARTFSTVLASTTINAVFERLPGASSSWRWSPLCLDTLCRVRSHGDVKVYTT